MIDKTSAKRLLKRWGETGEYIEMAENRKKIEVYRDDYWNDIIDTATKLEAKVDDWVEEHLDRHDNLIVYYHWVEKKGYQEIADQLGEPLRSIQYAHAKILELLCATWS